MTIFTNFYTAARAVVAVPRITSSAVSFKGHFYSSQPPEDRIVVRLFEKRTFTPSAWSPTETRTQILHIPVFGLAISTRVPFAREAYKATFMSPYPKSEPSDSVESCREVPKLPQTIIEERLLEEIKIPSEEALDLLKSHMEQQSLQGIIEGFSECLAEESEAFNDQVDKLRLKFSVKPHDPIIKRKNN